MEARRERVGAPEEAVRDFINDNIELLRGNLQALIADTDRLVGAAV